MVLTPILETSAPVATTIATFLYVIRYSHRCIQIQIHGTVRFARSYNTVHITRPCEINRSSLRPSKPDPAGHEQSFAHTYKLQTAPFKMEQTNSLLCTWFW